jgi:hypothetical protein
MLSKTSISRRSYHHHPRAIRQPGFGPERPANHLYRVKYQSKSLLYRRIRRDGGSTGGTDVCLRIQSIYNNNTLIPAGGVPL